MQPRIITLHEIPMGATLTRPKFGPFITHFGIYCGDGRVFDSTIPTGPRIVPFADFAQGYSVNVVREPVLPEWELWQRINAEITAGRPYHLLANNCEHVVNRVLFKIATSPQVQGGVAVAVIAVVLAAI